MPKRTKKIIPHERIYISEHTINHEFPYVIFVHGGPGLNAGVVEHMVESGGIYDTLEANIVFYDQRSCGRSKLVDNSVGHTDNVTDLGEIVNIIVGRLGYSVVAIIGHSYGAKVVFDYFQTKPSNILGIFIASAPSILKPRLTNLILDLNYLKTTNPELYMHILSDFDGKLGPEKIWAITERLAETFKENKARPFFYWANLITKEEAIHAAKSISLPINADVFCSVRKQLYSNEEGCSVDPEIIPDVKSLWINGFHDLIMGGPEAICTAGKKISPLTFFKSAHYPHLEEPDLFCEKVNEFIKK